MFQPPVNNLEKIRKARKRVKQILLQVGLESCRDMLEDINTYNPGDKHFSSTSWEDVSLWESNGRRNDYRSKPFCCSLCKFSTKLQSSFKNHLQRYHEEEKDLELLATCPSCPFTSQSKTVLKHTRMFHNSVRKIQKPTVKENPNLPRSNLEFSCLKCPFTETLYYSIKKHVLMTHYESLATSYFGEKPEEELIHSGFKPPHLNRFYCKKCSYIATSHDALVYHILTSEKHRDLEQKLQTDILEFSNVKRIRSKKLAPALHHQKDPTCVQPVVPPSKTTTISAPQDLEMVSFPQNGQSQGFVGTASNLTQNAVPAMPAVSCSSGSLIQNPPTTVNPESQVGFLTASLPQNQNITLQSSLSQSVFVSSRFPVNQPVNASVMPQVCNVNGQIIPIPQGNINPGVLPMNPPLHGGLHSANQSAILTCPQTLQPNMINMNQAVRPAIFPMNQGLRPENFNANQSMVSQNTFLSTPLIRQLIPTGKQVNGMPTYTLITLPLTQCAVPVANSQKVPVQLPPPEQTVQVSRTSTILSSPSVVPLTNRTTQQANSPASETLGKEAKQWKTCPVCNELFPSNVYQVHMQVAHVQGNVSLCDPKKPAICNEIKKPVIIAGQASFLKVRKDKNIRCLCCRIFAQDEELLKHLMMHGLVCLYCKTVFYELRYFVYHMKVMHLGTKKLHIDFMRKGIDLARDANDEVLFSHFDFSLMLSNEELGDRDIHLAVIAGTNSHSSSPIYIKIQNKPLDSNVYGKSSSKCPFCNCLLSKTEAYETHLKERHHIMPTLHTILKTPAFKCIHCCGVYTGSMTLSAIAVHLLRCRNAPKDSSISVEVLPENSGGKGPTNIPGVNECAKTKLACSASDMHHAGEEKGKGLNTHLSGPDALDNKSSPVPYKRRRLEVKSDASDVPMGEDALSILALVPEQSVMPYESKKAFLTEYFNIKPYPSKKEIEVLSIILDMWKSDVASHFGMKRYMCLKFIKHHKYRVMLGFQMSALKNLKHDLDLDDNY